MPPGRAWPAQERDMSAFTIRGTLWLTFLAVFTPAAMAQIVSGSIVGTVVDPQGAAVPGAQIRLVSTSTGNVRELQTGASGDFSFNAVLPGEYSLEVEHAGFRKLDKRGIVLTAGEPLSLGEIRMALGAMADSITVVAEGAMIQSASGERSGIVTSSQVESLTVINRDFAVLAALMPGVLYEPTNEVQGFGSEGQLYVAGGRYANNNVTVDGQPTDNYMAGARNIFISMDAISTVRVMVSNFQAEFGRRPGASIQAVSKSGTRDLHGSAFFYKRHDFLNANNYFNNRDRVPKPINRYVSGGFTLGGPLYIPGLFNRKKEKLFFFFSHEQFTEYRPQAIRQITMPTAMERRGDFSDSRDLNGALMTVLDPAANRTAFPGNQVPASRINRATQTYLNLLPLPNFFDLSISARRYNYQVQESLKVPKHTETARLDYNLTPKTNIYGRFNYWWEDLQGWAVPAGNSNWGWFPNHYNDVTRSGVLSVTRILSPSTVLEASFGTSLFTEDGPPLSQQVWDQHVRHLTGATIPQLYPKNNPGDLLPQATFAGVTGAVSTSYESGGRFPLHGRETVFTYNSNITRTHGAHVSKAGIMAERWRANKGEWGNFAGTIKFDRDTVNPLDANHPFANALLGNFASYTEATDRPPFYARSTDIEWFVQDNWKARRNLVLDFGLRMCWGTAWHTHRRAESGFVPERWDPKQRVSLISPATVSGTRIGVNPLTGQSVPVVAIGALVPGSGNIINGIVQTAVETDYPPGMHAASGINFGPRFGFAWDPAATGKTVLRGGFGVFNDIHTTSSVGYLFFRNPPMVFNPNIYYGNVDTLASLAAYNFPSDVAGFQRENPWLYVMNYSFGVQRQLKFKTIIDVAYVGSVSRHLMWSSDLNSVPFGTNFLASSKEAGAPTRTLSVSFLRPYVGYNSLKFYSNGATANYNSLQVSGNRRFARGLEFGGSWTWSKTMDFNDSDTIQVSALVNPWVWNYGKAGFDRTHIVKINWIWDIPRASRLWKNRVVKGVLDGWQLSGIASFVSGAPLGMSTSVSNTSDITGSPTDTAARPNLVANPVISRGERSFGHNFNTAAFAPPVIGTPGNAAKDLVRGPGINNFDASLFKNIRLPYERLRLQLRCEAYNALNHTQFSALDTSVRFDAAGRQINTALSQYTAARQPRRAQLSLRLNF
jgi:hypothetical protein